MTSPWVRQALAAGGHLADDVAGVVLAFPDDPAPEGFGRDRVFRVNPDGTRTELAVTLVSDEPALD